MFLGYENVTILQLITALQANFTIVFFPYPDGPFKKHPLTLLSSITLVINEIIDSNKQSDRYKLAIFF